MLMRDAVRSWKETVVEEMHRGDRVVGVASGLERLDSFTGGFPKHGLSVVSGPPRSAKTALLVRTALTSVAAGIPTAILATRTTKHELLTRLLAAFSGVDIAQCRCGFFAKRDWEAMSVAMAALEKAELWVSAPPGLDDSLASAVSRADETFSSSGRKLGLVLVDDVGHEEQRPPETLLEPLRRVALARGFAVVATLRRACKMREVKADAFLRIAVSQFKHEARITRVWPGLQATVRVGVHWETAVLCDLPEDTVNDVGSA